MLSCYLHVMLPRLPVTTGTIVLPTNLRLHLTAGAEYTYSYGGATAYDPQSPRRRVVPRSRRLCRLPRVSLTYLSQVIPGYSRRFMCSRPQGTWDGRTSYYNTTSCGRPDTPVAEGSRSPSAVDVHAIPPPASRRCHRFTRFLIAHNTSCAKKTLHVLPSSGYMGWTNLILQYHILWSSRYACRRRFPLPFGGRRPCDPPTCQSQVP